MITLFRMSFKVSIMAITYRSFFKVLNMEHIFVNWGLVLGKCQNQYKCAITKWCRPLKDLKYILDIERRTPFTSDPFAGK